jgi:Chromo (CHRromatin Organisation MOdifier) domain
MYDAVLTITDHSCSKAALFFPCTKKIDAEGVATLYAEKVFPHYGVPRKIISDRDLRFTADFAKAVCGQLKIHQNISTVYHPQTDGQSERANARLEQYIRIYGNAEQDNWVNLLPLAQYVHNSWTNASTGYAPFELLIGHVPQINVTHEETNVPEVARRKVWLEHARQRVQAVIKAAQNMLVTRTQRKKGQRHYHGHAVGDKVWLEGTNLKLTHPKAKLDAKCYGPFTVTEEISPVVYRVELPQQWKIHNVFHASLLTPYKETEEHGTNYAQPPPELVKGEEEYEVKQVLNSRRTGRTKKLQYLLWWKGYSWVHDSWQDATEVHAPELVADYLARKPSAVRTTTIKGHAGDQGNPIFMNSLHTPYGEDDEVLLFADERRNAREAFCNHAWMEAQL